MFETQIFSSYLLLCTSLSLHIITSSLPPPPSPNTIYYTPSTFFKNYEKMLQTFKIYTYPPDTTTPPISFSSPIESLFFSFLRNSPFLTSNPEEAHLFFLPFSSHTPTRSLARLVHHTRLHFPYWNRTLGADHFYLSCSGLAFESDRNLLELKKNSIQISCFPAPEGKFIPHKDITLPPPTRPHAPADGVIRQSASVNDTMGLTLVERLKSRGFCLFDYGGSGRGDDVSGIADALRAGCVPVVVTDRPIQDLPLIDVLRWQDMAFFAGSTKGLTRGLSGHVCGEDDKSCEGRRGLGVAGSRHLVWNEKPESYDAFHMVMYQLWIRRHTIRYARREIV